MKTIEKEITSTLEVNKSQFITVLCQVKNLDEVKDKLNSIKNVYKEATHYCYAYIIDDIRKSSDDGEPGGTAGIPIMEVLLKNDINYVLCIVIRYFGGIKLGTGGLVRAYSKSVREALKKASLIELVKGKRIEFIVSYSEQKNIDYLLKDYEIKKEYSDNIKYSLYLPNDKLNLLNNINYEIKEELYIPTSASNNTILSSKNN